jgi:hypothetical protein
LEESEADGETQRKPPIEASPRYDNIEAKTYAQFSKSTAVVQSPIVPLVNNEPKVNNLLSNEEDDI